MQIYGFLDNRKKATVSEIVDFVGLTQPTVSYHLNEMKKNGILVSSKKGKEVFYTLSDLCPHFHENCVLRGVKFPKTSHA